MNQIWISKEMTDLERKRDARGPTPTMGGMAFLFGQVFLIPLRTMLYGMEMLVRAMQSMQTMGDRGVKLMAGSGLSALPPPEPAQPELAIADWANSESFAGSAGTDIGSEETKQMDKDLNDDMLKLVRYKILFVKRDFEHAFKEEEELVSDNLDGSSYTAWKVAEFIQKLGKEKVPAEGKLENYDKEYRRDGKLIGLKEDDKKYLRVFYEVLERYPREKLKYEEDHLEVLRQIRDRMPGEGKGMNVG